MKKLFLLFTIALLTSCTVDNTEIQPLETTNQMRLSPTKQAIVTDPIIVIVTEPGDDTAEGDLESDDPKLP